MKFNYNILVFLEFIPTWGWGLGIGDWGLGSGHNPQSPIPNPQTPIPNPQNNFLFMNKIILIFIKKKNFLLVINLLIKNKSVIN